MGRVCALALLGLLLAPVASASPEDDARQAYQEGAAAYNEGHYDRALERFQQALRSSGRTALLYNIALCYERLGAPRPAADTLRRYLAADPDAPDRATIERRLVELEARALAVEQGARVTPVPQPAAAPRPMPRRPKIVWGFVAVGAAALAAALGTGVAAHLDYQTLDARCTDGHCAPGLVSVQTEGDRLAVATDALLAVGGAATIGAIIAGVLEARAARRAAEAGR